MKPRALDDSFFNEFVCGKYKTVVDQIRQDDSLFLCLRGNYVSIYYKSLLILKIHRNGNFYTDKHYEIQLPSSSDPDWQTYFKNAKVNIDEYNKKHRLEKLEKEIQQAIVRENNFCSVSNLTDYFIIDIEYTQKDSEARFDALGVLWPRNKRRSGKDLQMAFMEIKMGDKSLQGNSGVMGHYRSATRFVQELETDLDKKKFFFDDTEKVITQLRKLGLWKMNCNENRISFSRFAKPQLIFILADYNQHSTRLKTELDQVSNYIETDLQNNPPLELLFATSSFMGYGLYEECMLDLSDFGEKIKGK